MNHRTGHERWPEDPLSHLDHLNVDWKIIDKLRIVDFQLPCLMFDDPKVCALNAPPGTGDNEKSCGWHLMFAGIHDLKPGSGQQLCQ